MTALSLGVGCFLLALACSWWKLRTLAVPTGWEAWMRAPKIGGGWAWLIALASTAASYVSLYGYGAPAAVRAGLGGTMIGLCAPWFVEGVSRWYRRKDESQIT